MIKKIHICDKCGEEVITKEGEKSKYRTIQMGISRWDNEYPNFSSEYFRDYALSPKFYICPDCQKLYGINNEIEKIPYKDENNIANNLLDQLVGLIAERLEER